MNYFQDSSERELYDEPNYNAEPVPDSDVRFLKNHKIACILDEFSYECFKYEAVFVQLEPDSWQETMVREKPDLLFVESAWKGKESKWRYKIGGLHKSQDNTLLQLVSYCRKNNVPAVFWNKEDPANFDYFIEAAKLFDYVFTTDYNSIPGYKEILGHDNIYTLPFAAQPKLHNPVNRLRQKIGGVAFAGTWYNQKHADRRKDLAKILPPALDYGLHIYDRMYEENNPDYKFPGIYNHCIRGCLNYREMLSAYKKYDIFLNVNSVNNSPTMFSRRVFELLACGTSIISFYSPGIEEMLPGLVKLSRTGEETGEYLQDLITNNELRDKTAVKGQREVFNYHVYRHRLETVFNTISLGYAQEKTPGVSVITIADGYNNIEHIAANFQRQLYPLKELIVILRGNETDITYDDIICQFDNIKVFRVEHNASPGYCLNYGIEKASFSYISPFTESDYYAPNFLVDLIHAFKYTDAGIAGKHTYYLYIQENNILAIRNANMENRYVNYLCHSAMIAKKEIFNKVRFKDSSWNIEADFLKNCINAGIKLYSTDRFNYVAKRYSPIYRHNLKINGSKYMTIITGVDDYLEYITT